MSELTPGLYPNVPYDVYSAWDAINHSRLRRMRLTPMHMRYEMLHQKPPTKALDFGWAVHIAVLQPEELEEQVLVIPKLDRRKTQDRLSWEAFERKAKGRMLVDEAQMEKLEAIRESVLAHPSAREYVTGGGRSELSIVWTDSDTGVLCKARLDRIAVIRATAAIRNEAELGEEMGVIADLKTIGEAASQRAFEKSAFNFGYFEQAAMYVDGLQAVCPAASERPFIWIVAETEPPFAVRLFQPDELGIAYGRKEYKKHLAMYAECKRTNIWPGWADGVDTCSVPAWVGKVFELETA